MTYPDTTYITYEYDELNRLTCVKNQAGTALATYTYDERSRRTGLDYLNGAYANYSYDAASRLLVLDNQTNNGQHKYAYTYDYVGNRLDMTVTNAGGVGIHLYSYDNIYQITEVNYPDSLSYLATDTEFNYDAAGNRTSVIDGSGTCNYTTNNLNQYTAAGPTNFSYDSSGNMTHDADYGYAYDPENRLIQVTKSGGDPPDALAEALDCGLIFITDGNNGGWSTEGGTWCYHDWDCASGTTCDEGADWLQTTVQGAGTLKFWWKVSSETWDVLEFYIDDDCKHSISGTGGTWAEKTYTITGAGTHTLRWRYAKDSSESDGEDRGWVDYVQWTGAMEEPDPNEWSTLNYVYDPAGRRVEKKYDGRTVLKYVYDGDHCIAEYDAGGNLKRKYIYGPAVDEPICMIESTGAYAGTYYYHFDALGSVVALTNSSGNTVQVYEYDVYGRVGATDASHPNRFMFTGREFDKETGLYYYRARYYNPQIGRFLQTDPIGYGGGMNLYAYCGNNSTNFVDPSGLKWEDPSIRVIFYDSSDRADSIASQDHFWDLRIDMSEQAAAKAGFANSAEYLKHIFSGNVLRDKIMAAMPVDERTGLKIYDWDTQVTIEGVWFLDHGSQYGNQNISPGDPRFEPLFKAIGEGLDNNNGGGATIHLRGCQGTGLRGVHNAIEEMTAAAKASGHAVTSPLGDLWVVPGPRLKDPPYYSPEGFGKVTPIRNADGSISTSSRYYYGYEAMVNFPTTVLTKDGPVDSHVYRRIYQNAQWVY